MEAFGKELQIKRFGCNCLDEPGQPIDPSVNLFVKVTKSCNAHCLFCSNAETSMPSAPFNVPKLLEIIRELKTSGIRVNRVNITGGEPSVVSALVEEILQKMEDPDFTDLHLHLSKLSELYGCEIPNKAFDFEGIDRQRLNASCNLIKGYIDSPEKASKMLDFALELGLPRIGFVALMKVNAFCQDHFVDLEDIHLDTLPHVYFTKSMDRGSDCKCSNYLYNKNLKILEIYMRNYANPQYCESSLVYDGEFLRQGFHQNNIIY